MNPLRKRRWLAAMVAAVCLVGAWWCLIRDWCPRYAGHTLREYLRAAPPDFRSGYDNQNKLSEREITNSVRAMKAEAIPWLLEELHATDSVTTLRLYRFINRFSPVAIDRESADVRQGQALVGFAILGESGKSAIPALIEDLQGPFSGPAVQALELIGRPAIPAMLGCLRDKNEKVRSLALDFLGKIAPDDASVVPQIVAALDDPVEDVRIAAMSALGSCGNAAAPAVPKLENLMQDGTESESSLAIRVLGWIGVQGPQLIPLMAARLSSTNSIVQTAAAEALIGFNRDPDLVIDAFESLTKSGDPEWRKLGAVQLGRFGQQPKRTVALLSRLAGDPNRGVRSAAMEALSSQQELKTAGAEVAPALLARLNDVEPFMRITAAQLLGKIGADAEHVIPALMSHLDDNSESVRTAIATALGDFGGAAESVIPELKRRVAAGNEREMAEAIGVLGRIGRQGKDVIPVILPYLDSPNKAVQFAAFIALGRFQENADTVLPILKAATTHTNSQVRFIACMALGYLKQPAESIIPLLVARLGDSNQAVQHAAVDALGMMGPAALPAESPLVKLQQGQSKDSLLDYKIKNALMMIRGVAQLPQAR